MSKLNQAVLIQLAALICFFALRNPLNLIGWPLLILGGIMYRDELKRRKAEKAKQTAPTPDNAGGQK